MAIGRLFTERSTKSKESRVRRANLRTNNLGCFPHLLPNLKRHCVHIKQSYLLAALSPETIDADCRQEVGLPRREQVPAHPDCWRIFDVLHILRVLGNDLIVQRCRGLFRGTTLWKIIRLGTGVMLWDAHAAPRMENEYYVRHQNISEAMARMIADVDYSNFKHEVARMQGQKRSILYREVWACS